ncbi:MAG TPA: methylmalonyl Co-A mutase-associated GTPase MeaB [Candidatus Kapabacteria bacterium]|nr:methylmalonyl Co-A mutase-associated GTPase MeaB [Candidatus Kapabacteria bacterium]
MTESTDRMGRIEAILNGDRLAITRAITAVENERAGWDDLLSHLYSHTGRAYRIGITGPPGAGKSTMTQKLIAHYTAAGLRVAVIAVDPTSPFTGGAILGDRVRMQSESMKAGVFVRSMATRGSLGGLNTKAQDVADILDAAGFDIVIYETVGVGQSELDIAKAADSTVVVLVPESGDSIQAMKSGLMEIADLFVMNKSDREGADQAVAALKTILTFRITHADDEWVPDVVRAVATEGKGIEEVAGGIEKHREYMLRVGLLEVRRTARERSRVERITERLLHTTFWTPERIAAFEAALPALSSRTRSPLDVARQLTQEAVEGFGK